MRLLLYEPNHTGHHYPYIARMLPGLTPLDIEIVLATTPEGLASKEFERTLAPFADRLRLEPVCTLPPKGRLANARHRLAELVDACRTLRPDHAFVMYADAMWQIMVARGILGWRLPCPATEIWVYRGGFSYPDARGWFNKATARLMKRVVRTGQFTALHLVDELAYDFARHHWKPGGPTLSLEPESVQIGPELTRAEARQKLGVPADGRLAVLSAMINEYKGADRLLRAFAEHHRAHPGDRLLLAGPHADEIPEMLAQDPFRGLVGRGAIVSQDRFLDDEEMYLVAAAGDLTVAPYPRHSGRSSIILWAAAAGRPVLGAARGCIGHVIRTERLGHTVDPTDHAAFVTALGEALDAPWTDKDAKRTRSYAQTHSVERYRESVSSLIRERLRTEPALAGASAGA